MSRSIRLLNLLQLPRQYRYPVSHRTSFWLNGCRLISVAFIVI